MIIRWPHLLRWFQTQRDGDPSPGNDPTKRILALAADADTPKAFEKSLRDDGIEASWTDDAELWGVLHAETPPDLSIVLAASRGLW